MKRCILYACICTLAFVAPGSRARAAEPVDAAEEGTITDIEIVLTATKTVETPAPELKIDVPETKKAEVEAEATEKALEKEAEEVSIKTNARIAFEEKKKEVAPDETRAPKEIEVSIESSAEVKFDGKPEKNKDGETKTEKETENPKSEIAAAAVPEEATIESSAEVKFEAKPDAVVESAPEGPLDAALDEAAGVSTPEPAPESEAAAEVAETVEPSESATGTMESSLRLDEGIAYATSAANAFAGVGEATNTAGVPSGRTRYQGPKTISIENEFIKILANVMPVDTGRFLVRTVKGDPFRDTDDDKILIYGGSVPWTSFTTIRIDSENYVFGGPTHRRAGRNALYGEVTSAPSVIDGTAITTSCEIDGLEVVQTLSFAGGPISKLYDTVRINTVVRNPGYDPHRIGLRMVIDTLLGSNDGSPFKVGERSITSEAELTGVDIRDYWIAYDSLEDPGVVARGTLRGPGLTTPDRVVFANWGKLADNEWNIPSSPGQTFQREGEEDMDSATALYWDEVTIMPGGELQFTTLYGIEYLNVAGEILSIGAVRNLGEWSTAKNQIRPYTLYGYIGNSSEIELSDVRIKLDPPDGIEFVGDDDGLRRLGTLAPGSEMTIGWAMQPRVAASGEKTIKITGSAREVVDVKLETLVTLLAPPGIDTSVIAPERIERAPIDKRDYGSYGPPFPVRIRCRNKGSYHIDNVRVRLELPEGMEFPRIHKAAQAFTRLDGGRDVEFSWKVIATGEKYGPLEYKVVVESDSTERETFTGVIEVEPLPVTVSWMGVPEKTVKRVFIPAEIFITDAVGVGAIDFSVEFDPEILQVVRVSQGTLFVENGLPLPWTEPLIDNRRGIVSGISGSRNSASELTEGSLVIIHFMTKGEGTTGLEVIGLEIKKLDGSVIEDFTYLPTSVTVE